MNSTVRVLIVSNEKKIISFIQNLLVDDRTITCSYLTNFEYEVLYTDSLTNYFKNAQIDVMILTDNFQQFSNLELIKLFKRNRLPIPIIVISKRNETSLAVEVIKAGGDNFLVQTELTYQQLVDAIYSAMQTLEEKRQLEKIQAENQKLLKAIEQSPVSIMITKAETDHIEYVNPMFSKLTGYSKEEIIGKSPSVLNSGTKKTFEYKHLWDTILAGLTWKGEFLNRKKDGSLFCTSAVISPIKINNNKISHYVGIHQDITQQKEAELQLKNYAKKLEKKSKQLEEAYQEIEDKIQRARQLHRHFFPIKIPAIKHIELDAYYQSAHKIGSDYYNYVKINNQLLIYIVDVSGSGIDGAFINIFIRQKINRFLYVEGHTKQISPKGLLNFLAQHFIEEKFPDKYFACLYVVVLNLATKQLTYSNAGIQVPPVLIRQKELISLDLGGLPISSAIPLELLLYEEKSLSFDEDSTLVISTDGIIESVIDGEMFGIKRFQAIVHDYWYLPPSELKKVINLHIEPIVKNIKNHDDITYVILQNSSKTIDKKELLIPSDCCALELVVKQLSKWLANYTNEVNKMIVGFNEMVYNSIEHGNKFDVTKKINIKIIVKKTYITFTIEDEGYGFEWPSHLKRSLDIMNFEERGRGIIFAKASFDYITYNQKGNKVSLYKKI